MTSDMVATSNRRRRRPMTGLTETSTTIHELSSSQSTGALVATSDDDYYDDDSDSELADPTRKSSHHHDRMYNNACSLGQFMLNPCLCLARSCGQIPSCWARIRRKQLTSVTLGAPSKGKKGLAHIMKTMGWIDCCLVGGVVTVFLISLCCIIPLTTSSWPPSWFLIPPPLRPATDDDVNNIPLLLPCWDYQRWNIDIGGWQFTRIFYYPTIPLSVERSEDDGDYGDLEFVGPFGQPRLVRPDDQQIAEAYLQGLRWKMVRVPAFDEHVEDVQDEPTTCRPQQWAQWYFPSCNAFHELDLKSDYDESRAGLGDDQIYDSFYISHGYWRDVWVVHQVIQNVKSILKVSRWKHPYDMEIFWFTLHDALVMERLTKSPRIVDIYGHCGFSVWVEAIPFEIEPLIVPGDGMLKGGGLHVLEEFRSMNDFTDEEKLNMALAMAESIADLHGFEDGMM